jgi:hypothetical protein
MQASREELAMSNVHGTGGIDETHGGLQKLYFVCFSNPARPPLFMANSMVVSLLHSR